MTDSLETKMNEVMELLRTRFPDISFSAVTENAVIDEDADGDGRLDDNPDTGAGSESGYFTVSAHRNGESKAVLREGSEGHATVHRLLEDATAAISDPNGWI